jgi:hypothetical protein
MRLGVFAILFQAILFGWHHHDLVFAGHQQQPVVHSSPGPAQTADDEDGCEICQVLHHQALSSGSGIATPLPGMAASPSVASAPLGIDRTLALAFRARGPPLV